MKTIKKTWGDKASDLVLDLIRPILKALVHMTFNVHASGLKIGRKRKEPFFLIGNHVTTWDAFIATLGIKYPIRFIATEVAFLDFDKRLGMEGLARSIRKRVGKKDAQSVKKTLTSIRKGYAIGIYPEGDDTFYGETLDCYHVGKLMKKAELDVFCIIQKGSHLSQPRWADHHAKKGDIFLQTDLLLSKEEIKALSAEDIQKVIETAIYHNEYDWQKTNMIVYNRKKRAEGIERLVYYCNRCGAVMSITGQGNDMVCSKCGIVGTINEYGLIEGNSLDNLVDYNHYQYQHMDQVLGSEFEFSVLLNRVDFKKSKRYKVGEVQVTYKNKKLYLKQQDFNQIFEIEKIEHPVNTMKHSFTFTYEGKHYEFYKIRHQFVLYEMCRYLNGSYKS